MPIILGDKFSFDQTVPKELPGGDVKEEGRTKIAIIGAGLAGLTCAFRLFQSHNGRLGRDQLLLLERETEVGGRIRSLRVGENVLNLGAVTFQPSTYHRYLALLQDLKLLDRVRLIPRRRMAFGYNGRIIRADNLSIILDALRGFFGRGIFTPVEVFHLLRFQFFLQRMTAPGNEAALVSLNRLSVAEWSRQFGFDAGLMRKFVMPFTRFCFRSPDEVSAAIGVHLMGFNLSRPATLKGGFGQIADRIADRLGRVIELDALVLRVKREVNGFSIFYLQRRQLRRLRSNYLVVAVPANVAGQLVPEMRKRTRAVGYGSGYGALLRGDLRPQSNADLHLHTSIRPDGTIVYGGEAQSRKVGGHYMNVLTYRGENASEAARELFVGGRAVKLVEYRIQPASQVPMPGQDPLPMNWQDGLLMAGDCVGPFPSQETAVRSGEAAAAELEKVVVHE